MSAMATKLDDRQWSYLFAAFALAGAASLSVLFVGEVLGQEPCNLCWFQRAFMFPLAVVLAVASLRSDPGAWCYAAPLAVGGWLIAGFHSLLYAGIIPEAVRPCTATGPSCSGESMTIFGSVPLPLLSWGAFSFILALIFLAYRKSAP